MQEEQVTVKPSLFQSADQKAIKPGDVEQTLRQLLDLPDAQIFDSHMIL